MPITIMRHNGAILRRNGAIAMSYRCCCPGEPPLPQTCCYDEIGAWDNADPGGVWPNVLYGQMSGFGCPALNHPFYMAATPGLGIPYYRSQYVGGVSAIPCVPSQRSWSWRIDLQCLGDAWGIRLSDSVPWSNGDFSTLYPVTLLGCVPLVLHATNLPDAIFGLNTTGTDGAIVLTSEPP
jgi:hypothetical protein